MKKLPLILLVVSCAFAAQPRPFYQWGPDDLMARIFGRFGRLFQAAPPTNWVLASTIPTWVNDGCNYSTGLNTSSAACASNSALMNIILASGRNLWLDTGTGISAEIQCPHAGCMIDGPGGIFSLANCNCRILTNTWPNPAPGSAPTPAGTMIVRNISINANAVNNHPTGVCASTEDTYCIGIFCANLTNCTIQGVTLTNYPSFGIVTSNNTVNWISGVAVFSGPYPETDPIHLDGPNGVTHISDSTLAGQDDGIAANACEGLSGNMGAITISGVLGPNNPLTGTPGFDLFESYNEDSGTCQVGPITITNSSGTYTRWAINMRGAAAPISYYPSLKISNSFFNLPYGGNPFFYCDNAIEEIDLEDVTWQLPAAYPLIGGGGSCQVSKLTLRNVGVQLQTSTAAIPAFVQLVSGDSVRTLRVEGLFADCQLGQTCSGTPPAVVDIQSGASLTNLEIGTMPNAANQIAALVSSAGYSQITNVFGFDPFPVTIANLPPCTTAEKGILTGVVTNASSPAWNAAFSGTGSVVSGAMCNGTAWVAH